MARFLSNAGTVFLRASVLCGIALFATEWYWHERGEFPFLLEMLHVLLMLVMLVIPLTSGLLGVVALAFVFRTGPADRGRLLRSAGAFALACILAIAILQASPNGLPKPRRAEFVAVAEGAQPLVGAIRQYESDHGSPPCSLADLVPSHLPAIPKTGHARYPEFEYASYKPGGCPAAGVTWTLWVPCSLGFLNWDEFFYWPTEDYPEQMGSDSIERIGRWAYLHE